jgi:hypothetical protein
MLITYPQPSLDNLGSIMKVKIIFHTDGKRSLFEKSIPFIKGIALKNKLRLINSQQPGKGSILDIGAGTGDFWWQRERLENSGSGARIKQDIIEKAVSLSKIFRD